MSLLVRWVDRDAALDRVDAESRKVAAERREVYGDNWALMSLDSLLGAAGYKVERAKFTVKAEKRLDDVYDALNYLRYVAVRLLREMEGGAGGVGG